MNTQDDDDEEVTDGVYENGHWIWDEKVNELIFKRLNLLYFLHLVLFLVFFRRVDVTHMPGYRDYPNSYHGLLAKVFQKELGIVVQIGSFQTPCLHYKTRKEMSKYVSDAPEVVEDIPMTTAILGAVEFREDIDLNEQQRFRKRIQRRSVVEENDIVTLQDIKDVVLFTAPHKILKPVIINMLHLPATERLLRALIFFCQYYLQVSEIMNLRTLELLTKVRTPDSDIPESLFLENLEDLRLLVAKEYSNFLTGSGEFARYHHMGSLKKSRSLSKRDSLLFETFVRIAVQIIWVALGRKSFTQIELEVNRIFKSPVYNSAEHKLTKDAKMKLNVITANERKVLLGHCLCRERKVHRLSPLMNEVYCQRDIDHRIYGLGIVKYPRLTPRLRYMEYAISLPECSLIDYQVSVGILGLPRSRFDILLKEIKIASVSTSSINIPKNGSKATGTKTSKSNRKSLTGVIHHLYKNIELPPKDHEEDLLSEFPTESYPRRACDEVQRQKWMQRILRKAAKQRSYRQDLKITKK